MQNHDLPCVSIKFVLQRKPDVETHRIRGSFTFGEVQTLVAQWWEGALVSYSYTDSDGDMVTMQSDAEWKECMVEHQRMGSAVVRVVVMKKGKKDRTGALLSESAIPSPLAPSSPSEQPIEDNGGLLATEPPAMDATQALLQLLPPGANSIYINAMFGMSLLDPDDLRFRASTYALHLMKKGSLTRARDVLSLAATLPLEREKDDIIIRYNLGCVHALLGDPMAALAELKVSVDHGYRNGLHMAKDEDLISLHGLEEFEQLLHRAMRENGPQTPQLAQRIPFDGPLFVTCSHSGLVWDIEGGSIEPGARLIQYCKHGGPNQQFVFEHAAENAFFIRCVQSGLYLDVAGGSTDNGVSIIQWPKHGGANQQFLLHETADGGFTVVTFCGKVLHVEHASKENCAHIVQRFILCSIHGPSNQDVFQLAKCQEPDAQPEEGPAKSQEAAEPPVPCEDPAVTDSAATSVEILMSVFPGMDTETAAEVLGHACGDIRRAIELFLGA